MAFPATPDPEPLDRETLMLATAGATEVLGPHHSATRALARATITRTKADLWQARLALAAVNAILARSWTENAGLQITLP